MRLQVCPCTTAPRGGGVPATQASRAAHGDVALGERDNASGSIQRCGVVVRRHRVPPGETSVTLFDPVAGRETARSDHDEIILRHEWAGDRLVLEDLQGRRFALRVLADEGRLVPVAHEH